MPDQYCYIEEFLKEILDMDNCPHYLDSLMIEHIIDSAGTDISNLKAVCGVVSEIDIKSSRFACTFCLKLLRKLLESNSEVNNYGIITSFLHRCIREAELEDFSLLSAVFYLLYIMEMKGKGTDLEFDGWNLAVSCLKSARTTLFVKKAASEYCKLSLKKNKNDVNVKSLVSSLCDPEDVFACTAEILLCCSDVINGEVAEKICSSAAEKTTFNFAYTKLLVTLFERNLHLKSLFYSKVWLSQRLKLRLLRDMIANGCCDVVPILLSEKNLILGDVLPCLAYLPDKQVEEYVDEWIQKLKNAEECPAEDVNLFLQLPCVSEAKYDPIYDVLKERFWKFPDFLKIMVKRHKTWSLSKQPEIIDFALSGLSSPDWERRDVAIDILRYLPEATFSCSSPILTKLKLLCFDDFHPFVRANILRFLDETHESTVMDMAVKTIKTDLFSEPRLEAVAVLERNLPKSEKWCCEILATSINDSDIEIQEKALLIASLLIKLGGEGAQIARTCLEKHLENESTWRNEINAVLGKDLNVNNTSSDDATALDLLKEALEKLKFPPDKACTEIPMDCY